MPGKTLRAFSLKQMDATNYLPSPSRSPSANKSDMTFVDESHAWFRQGNPKPDSMDLSKEKCVYGPLAELPSDAAPST